VLRTKVGKTALSKSAGWAGRLIRTNGSSAKEVNWPIQPSQSRYVWQCSKSMLLGEIELKGFHDHQDDDDRGRDTGDLVHDPQRAVVQRAFPGREALAVAAEPSLVG
jgi:hypothetical protein